MSEYEPAILWGGAVLTVRDCHPRNFEGRPQQPSGLAGIARHPVQRRTFPTAQRTLYLASCALRGETHPGLAWPGWPRGIMGSMGGGPGPCLIRPIDPADRFGTHPVNLVSLMSMYSRFSSFANSGGISPVNPFSWRASCARLARLPSSGGMSPLIWFGPKDRVVTRPLSSVPTPFHSPI